jgi:hypothetical protein
MTTIGHVFVPLDREHDGTVPTDDDKAHFESLPVPLALWEPFQQCLSKQGGGTHRRTGPAQLAHIACGFRSSRP